MMFTAAPSTPDAGKLALLNVTGLPDLNPAEPA
jgi:hypothetical protein